MAENELVDIVNKKGEIIGQAVRSECHGNPNLIHQVVHCWIFNSKGQILWQQRSLKKATSPGKWDISCGGHVKTGSTPELTIHVEIEEELGLTGIKPIFVEKYIDGDDYQTELIHLYYLVLNKPASEFKIQVEEIEKLEWINYEDALSDVFNNKRESTDFIFTQIPKIYRYLFTNK